MYKKVLIKSPSFNIKKWKCVRVNAYVYVYIKIDRYYINKLLFVLIAFLWFPP